MTLLVHQYSKQGIYLWMGVIPYHGYSLSAIFCQRTHTMERAVIRHEEQLMPWSSSLPQWHWLKISKLSLKSSVSKYWSDSLPGVGLSGRSNYKYMSYNWTLGNWKVGNFCVDCIYRNERHMWEDRKGIYLIKKSVQLWEQVDTKCFLRNPIKMAIRYHSCPHWNVNFFSVK